MQKTAISDLYHSIRRRLDVRQVLEHYGAQNCTESVSDKGETWITHSCLLDRVEPHHSNGDAHPSAWVCVETGTYCCATYWTGGLFHLIQKLEGVADLEDIMPIVGKLLSGHKDTAEIKQAIEKLFSQNVYSVEVPTYDERALKPWLKTHPYVLSRGISHETCKLLHIGWDEKENRIVFPHWWEGKLVGWQKRAIPPIPPSPIRPIAWPPTNPQFPKYRNSPGFPKSQTIYGYDWVIGTCLPVTVVESPMSVAKAYELRLGHTVATFGAKVSKNQIQLLREFPQVNVWFDDDSAGQSGCLKIVEGLHRLTQVRVVTPDKGRDLGDYNDVEEVCRKLEEAESAVMWLSKNRKT